MSMHTARLACLLLALLSVPTLAQRAAADHWKSIDAALDGGQMKSMLPKVRKLEREAAAKGQPLQQLKALVYEGRIRIATEDYDADTGRHPEADFLSRFDQARCAQPAASAARTLFDLYMAEFVRQFADSPRAAARTGLADTGGQKFDTWSRDDLHRLAGQLYAEATASDSVLRHTPRTAFATLIADNDPDHTATLLVDFVAPQAAKWFDGEGSDPARAEALLRSRAEAHASDTDKTAWLDALLQLEQHRTAYAPGDTEAQIDRLTRLARAHRSTPYAAVLWRQAATLTGALTELTDSARNVRRHAMLAEGLALFPESKWTAGLSNDLNETERAEIDLRLFTLNSPTDHIPLHIVHRNAGRPALRLERLDAATEADVWEERRESWQRAVPRKNLKATTVRTETLALGDFRDFCSHATVYDLGTLPRGVYRVTLSQSGKSASALFAVSSVAATLLPGTGGDTARVLFTDTGTGRPLAGQPLYYRPAGKPNATRTEGQTDADGCLTLPAGKSESQHVVVFPRLEDAVTANVRRIEPAAAPRTRTDMQITFLTDRAVYRLGQQVLFKVIAARDSSGTPMPAAGETLCVVLHGAGGEALDSLRLTTSTYGSAAGGFKLPASALPGRFALDAGGHGWTSFEVQEYKRPKFEVAIDPVKSAYALGDTLTLTGHATAYAGPALAGVPVTWRLEKRLRSPYRYPHMRPQDDRQTILAEGTTITGDDGSFSVRIYVGNDSLTAGQTTFMPTFLFTADVTDFGGETQSATHAFSAGHQRLMLALDTPDKVRATALHHIGVRTFNADGQSVGTHGRLTLTRMRTPRPARTLWPHRQFNTDYSLYGYDDFVQAFPFLRYENDETVFSVAGETVTALDFDTSESDSVALGRTLEPGTYLCRAETVVHGDTLHTEQMLTLLTDSLTHPGSKTFLSQHTSHDEIAAGETAEVVWRSDLPDAQLLISIERHGKLQPLQRLEFRNGCARLTFTADTADIRRGIYWQATLMAGGDSETTDGRLEVTDRPLATLEVKVNTFRTHLEPGAAERWMLTVTRGGRPVRCEVAATLYDAALDGFARHSFSLRLPRQYGRSLVLGPTRWVRQACSTHLSLNTGNGFSLLPRKSQKESSLGQPKLNFFGLNLRYPYFIKEERKAKNLRSTRVMSEAQVFDSDAATMNQIAAKESAPAYSAGAGETTADSRQTTPRRALQETGFFFPCLSVETGTGALRFTAPEALTRWRLLVLAHTDSLEYGTTELSIETRKPLMLTPALPRFVRRGDTLRIGTKITTTLDSPQKGTARLQLFDTETGESLDRHFGLENTERPFALAAMGTIETAWTITVPDRELPNVGVRLTAECEAGSDGEDNSLPILPRRATLLRTKVISVRPGQEMTAGMPLTKNDTRLTLELNTDMAVPALLALPSLAQPEHESCDQTLTRIYAAHAAEQLLGDRPELREAIKSWNRNTLSSALERNDRPKTVAIGETPWTAEADSERERAEAMETLLDDSLRAAGTAEAWTKLRARQNADGGFPWFDGGISSVATTKRIILDIGRIRALDKKAGGAAADTLLHRATAYLDSAMMAYVDRCAKEKTKPTAGILLPYFYARMLSDGTFALPARLRRMVRTSVDETLKPGQLNGMSLTCKAQTALTAWHYGLKNEARRLIDNLRETAVEDKERGLYWRAAVHAASWRENAVTAHATALLAFAEITPGDTAAREGIETWLAGNRRRTAWGSPQATADAVAALVLTKAGAAHPNSSRDINLRTTKGMLPQGTAIRVPGYLRITWNHDEITPNLSEIILTNSGSGTMRGGLTAEREADLRDFNTDGSGMSVEYHYYTPRTENGKTVLEERRTLRVGEKTVERIMIHTGEPLDFVHLRLDRPAGLEPADSRSGYVLTGNTAAYRSVRNDATHLFFDFLPAGTHVFEQELKAGAAGSFETGRTEIKCLYAPEYSARAASRVLKIVR